MYPTTMFTPLTLARLAGPAPHSEPRRLGVLAPLGPEQIADLTDRCLGAHGLAQTGQRRVHPGLVTPRSPLGEDPVLLGLHLVADAQDLELSGHRAGVAVDAHHLLVPLFDPR